MSNYRARVVRKGQKYGALARRILHHEEGSHCYKCKDDVQVSWLRPVKDEEYLTSETKTNAGKNVWFAY